LPKPTALRKNRLRGQDTTGAVLDPILSVSAPSYDTRTALYDATAVFVADGFSPANAADD